jgi:Tfp pilus assembly protein PilF
MDDHLKQLILLGREHYTKREFDRADYLLRQVIAETERHADVFDMLGVIAHSRGDFAQAERHFEKAVALNPNYTEAQLNLMVTYNDLGKYDKARDIYAAIRHRGSDGAAKNDPFARGKIANMHAETAQAYLDVGMSHEAIRELERAVALCPTFLDLRTRLAVLYRDAGSVELAKGQLEAALDRNPDYVPARLTLAVILLTHGEHEGAITELERALSSDPENRSAQMYLRLARVQRGRSDRPRA